MSVIPNISDHGLAVWRWDW